MYYNIVQNILLYMLIFLNTNIMGKIIVAYEKDNK